jgi:hypothetical protein
MLCKSFFEYSGNLPLDERDVRAAPSVSLNGSFSGFQSLFLSLPGLIL